MAHINKTQRVKFTAILLISNILVYLLFTQSPPNIEETSAPLVSSRENYEVIELQANLKTSFKVGKPVSITNFSRTILIKKAFLLEEKDEQRTGQQLLLEGRTNNEKSISVYLHRRNISKIITQKNLIVIPYDSMKLGNKIKRRIYEVKI